MLAGLFFGNDKPAICAHCGKIRGHHKAQTFECPKGRKHRTFGYSMFGPGVFEPKPAKKKATP